jgi:hypothetical protein
VVPPRGEERPTAAKARLAKSKIRFQALLDGACRDGDTLTVAMEDEKFVFRKDPPAT